MPFILAVIDFEHNIQGVKLLKNNDSTMLLRLKKRILSNIPFFFCAMATPT